MPLPAVAAAPLRVGLAGLGTVGTGTAALLERNAALIAARAGREIRLVAVSARDRHRDRGVDLARCRWHDDPASLAADPELDVVVELIGGAGGPARALVRAALAAGRSVVTANKALIAVHGAELAAAAEGTGVTLAFEAAVAGGIPVIKAVREGLAADRITRIGGILNGTCNYILSAMRDTGRDFDAVLAEAQALGYAEADPSTDVDGIDAAHKLSILAALVFGRPLDFAAVHVEGIRRISAADIGFAAELGYRIKLLGLARALPDGVEARVHPCLVPATRPLAQVEGVFNAVVVEGDAVGRLMLEGRGAGAGPTATAVVADLIDLARGTSVPAWGSRTGTHGFFPPLTPLPMAETHGEYYLRLSVRDRPGVIADVTAVLRDCGVSLRSMLQRDRAPEEDRPDAGVGAEPAPVVPVVLITHDCREAAMREALHGIAALPAVAEHPNLIRIERT